MGLARLGSATESACVRHVKAQASLATLSMPGLGPGLPPLILPQVCGRFQPLVQALHSALSASEAAAAGAEGGFGGAEGGFGGAGSGGAGFRSAGFGGAGAGFGGAGFGCAGAAFGGAAVGGLAVLRPRPGAVAVAVRGGLAGTGRMPEPWAGADIE